jgi:hypothetical protein
MTRYPRFRSGEVVRVAQMPEAVGDEPDVRGMEGTVSSFSPCEDGQAWSIGVWLDELEEVWSFDERQLESAGMVEVQLDERKTRVPIDPASHEESFGGELTVKLLTEIDEREAARLVNEAEAALRSLVPLERLTWKGEVHWHGPYRYDVELELWTSGDARDAFEAIVASRRSGWVSQVDDGWGCSFWWSADDDEAGEAFLVPEAHDVAVYLTPWSDPSSRPIKKGRTHDPGLPGFTPPPPAAGYE